MPATDDMAARLQEKINRAEQFIEELMTKARAEDRDLTDVETTLVRQKTEELSGLNIEQAGMAETLRIVRQSREATASLAHETARERRSVDDQYRKVEYRSVGEYALDVYRANLRDTTAAERLEVFARAAAHQTTADNPGLLPEQIVAPVLNFVDTARPLVMALGPQALPGGSWSRPRVTQHTLVGKQAGEKQELPSRRMVIGKIPIEGDTFGGYVNVSLQNRDWSQPQVVDIVVNDLAGQYAIETEAEAGTVFEGAATAGPTLPATPDPAAVSAALWAAAGTAFAAMQGQGRLILAVSPDMLGLVGPLFAPINPQNAYSTGFNAGAFGSGAMGAISGISVVMSAGLPDGTMLVINSAAAECWEDRRGALQVVEPSVLGVQVAYHGYFSAIVLEPAGIVSIGTTTPAP